MFNELSDDDVEKLDAVMDFGEYTSSTKYLINLVQNLDGYNFYPDISSEEDYGHYLVDECGTAEPSVFQRGLGQTIPFLRQELGG